MPTVLNDAAIADLLATTLAELGRMKFNQIASTVQRYEVMGRMLKEDKIEYQDGYEIRGNLLTAHNSSAKMVGLHESYSVAIVDVMDNFAVPWRHCTWNWAWERREGLYNRGASKIVDIIQTRRVSSLISAAELLENQAWSAPSDSSDTTDLWGIPYWVVSNATEGFSGGHPSGFSDVGGLDVATYSQWKNYTAQYVQVSEDDLLRKMRKAHRKTGWKSPVDFEDYSRGTGQRQRIYANEETVDGLESVARINNDSLGNNLTKYHDDTVFKRSPIIWVPKLDADTTDPIYMLDYNYLHLACLKGDTIYEHDPEKAPAQPNTWVINVDATLNFVCSDRRRQTVITK